MFSENAARGESGVSGSRRRSVFQLLSGIRGGARIALVVGLLVCFGAEGLWAQTHKLTVHPNGATLATNQTQRFRVYDQGKSVAVNWNISGPGCSGAACGSIDAKGNYQTPASLPQPAAVTVQGVLASDPTYSISAQVQLLGAVTVTVSPASVQLTTGTTQQFTANVVGGSNQIVTWSLSGAGCVGLTCGTITGTGLYKAPATPPTPPTVTVTATSLAASSSTGTATVTVTSPSPINVSVSPTIAAVSPGAQQQFSATVTGTNNQGVNWSVTGVGCFNLTCGTITSAGLYTAPATAPNPPSVTVTATSQADSSRSGSATVSISTTTGITVSVSPTNVQLGPGQQQQFNATVTGSGNTAVTWSLSGAGCAGATCGNITVGGLYTAPATVPSPPTVTVTATANADNTKKASAIVTLNSSMSVTVSPSSANVVPKGQQQFTATVTGSSNQIVLWGVSGPGCSGTNCGMITGTGLYTAPSSIPSPNTVTVTATSLANASVTGTATVSIGVVSPIVVTVTPSSANVVVGQNQQFNAQVTGTNNTLVTWSVAGVGCSGAACGTITQGGLYTAPATQPTPSGVSVIAISQADTTRSGSAIANITPNVVVSVSPPAVQLITGQKQQFMATVTGSGNTGVSWSISGPGCSGVTCGSISSGGLYTAPSVVPSPPNVTVTATAQADPTKSGTATVTVNAPIIVTVAPLNAQVIVNGQQQFVATVTGTNNTAVNWSLSGSSCPSACGSINSSGWYTAPATAPGSAVTVTATSQANGTSSGSATVQVIPSTNNRFSGQYAFLFRGTDANGFYEAAGSFTADGQGNITGGIEDINRVSGPLSNAAFSGTYSVKGDNRGTLVITNALGTFTYTFALNSTGSVARMIEADNTGVRGAGEIRRQDTTAFSNGALTNGYTVSLTGSDNSGGRIGVLASIFPNGAGGISGSSLDINDAGNPLGPYVGFSGTYNITANGRGTLSLSVPTYGNGTLDFAIYVVSATQIYLVSSDVLSAGNPLFVGSALQQLGAPFTNASFNGYSVFNQTGLTGGVPDVSVGRMTFDGKGTVSIGFDQNAGGSILIGGTLTGGYAVSMNGRTTLNLVNPKGQASVATMYAISKNTAFIMDYNSSSVHSGYLEFQAILPPFGDDNLNGSYPYVSTTPVGASVALLSAIATFDGNGNVTGNEDEDFITGPNLNQLMNGTYQISPVSKNGRGVIQLSSPQSQTIAVWMATYSRAYAIPVDAGDVEPAVITIEF